MRFCRVFIDKRNKFMNTPECMRVAFTKSRRANGRLFLAWDECGISGAYRITKVTAAALVVIQLSVSFSNAENYTWTGVNAALTNVWSNTASWSPQSGVGGPGAGDNIVAATTTVLRLNGDQAINSFNLAANTLTVSTSLAAPASLTANSIGTSGGTLQFNNSSGPVGILVTNVSVSGGILRFGTSTSATTAIDSITVSGTTSSAGTLEFNIDNTETDSYSLGLLNLSTGAVVRLNQANYVKGLATVNTTGLMGSGGTIANGSVGASNSSHLIITSSGTHTSGAAINNGTGTVLLTKNGTGTQILTANSSYTGGTTIADGVLQLGNNGTAGSIVGSVSLSGSTAALVINRSNAYSFTGTITGVGDVRHVGTGTTTLSTNNTYSGKTEILAGTLLLTGTSGAGVGTISLDGGRLWVNTGLNAGIANSEVVFTSTASRYLLQRGSGQQLSVYAAKSSLDLPEAKNTEVSILAGTVTSARSIDTSFATTSLASNDEIRMSDVFGFGGTDTDVFVLQLTLEGPIGSESFLALLSGGSWINATSLIGGGGEYAGSYGSYADFLAGHGGSFNATTMLGAYGVDVANGSVWAVINYGGEFAVVPEPTITHFLTMSLGSLFLIVAIRRRRVA